MLKLIKSNKWIKELRKKLLGENKRKKWIINEKLLE
jgi:hypothetical protein